MVRVELCDKILMLKGNIQAVFEKINCALKDAKNMGFRKAEADALIIRASLLWQLGNPDKGWTDGMQALSIYREEKDRRSEARALHDMGISVMNQGQFLKALASLQQSLMVYQSLKDRKNEGRVLADLGTANMKLGNRHEGWKTLHRALKIHKEMGDLVAEGKTYEYLGEAAIHDEHSKDSIRFLKKAIEIHQEVINRPGEGKALMHLSAIFHKIEEYDRAIEYGEKALAVFKEIGDLRAIGNIFSRFALIQISRGGLIQAQTLFYDAIKKYEDLNDLASKGTALRNLSKIVRWQEGDLSEAEALAHEAECIFRKLGDDLEIINCLSERGYVAFARKLSGREYFDEARQLAVKRKFEEHKDCQQVLNRFRKTLNSFESGQVLFYGECYEDLPLFLQE